jgi:outer membrane biosynthesis protein TonB
MAAVALVVVVASIGGCAWWPRWLGGSKPTASIGPPEGPPPRPVAEARAACVNYDRIAQSNAYPRDAYLRGILSGKATIRFVVTGSKIDISRVTSTDLAFGDAAMDAVRKLECRVDQPTVFEMAFVYRRAG